MYISKLRIQNYRNFFNFTIDLKPFTLIIGENNSGKTNLLNALGLVFNQDITFFKKRVLEYEDINCQAVCDFKQCIAENKIDSEKVRFPEVMIEVTMKDFTPDQEAVVGDWFIDRELLNAQLTYLFKIKGTFDKNKWVLQQKEKLKGLQKEPEESEEAFFIERLKMLIFPLKITSI